MKNIKEILLSVTSLASINLLELIKNTSEIIIFILQIIIAILTISYYANKLKNKNP